MYKIIQDSRGFVLINTEGEYENHGHLKKKKTCNLLIYLMERKIVPDSKYLRKTVLRVSTDEDYKDKVRRKIEKDQNRRYYINVNKGRVK